MRRAGIPGFRYSILEFHDFEDVARILVMARLRVENTLHRFREWHAGGLADRLRKYSDKDALQARVARASGVGVRFRLSGGPTLT